MSAQDIQIKNANSLLIIPATEDDLKEINIILYTSPVSSQSKAEKKKYFKKLIRKLTKQIEFIIAGDIQIEITWHTHEQLRYEAPNFIDIDNILKVIIDAISGPDGLIVDDCVVQHLSCTWIDCPDREYIEIKITYDDMTCFPKNNLCFLHLGNNLYHIASIDLPKEMLDIIVKGFQLREKNIKKSGNYYAAFGTMSIQRLFTRNKLRNFKLMNYEDFPSVKEGKITQQEGPLDRQSAALLGGK